MTWMVLIPVMSFFNFLIGVTLSVPLNVYEHPGAVYIIIIKDLH